MAQQDPGYFRGSYVGDAPQMFNPNETEEEKRKRYQAEALRSSVSDAQVSSQQKEYERLAQTGKGPKGRRVGSRDTFVAASPFEHIAHVISAGIKGKTRAKAKEELEGTLAKQAASRALDAADERIATEKAEERAAAVEKRAETQLIINKDNSAAQIKNFTSLENDRVRKGEVEQKKAEENIAHNTMTEKLKLYDLSNETLGDKNYKIFSDRAVKDISKVGNVRKELKILKDTYNPEWARMAGPFSKTLASLESNWGLGIHNMFIGESIIPKLAQLGMSEKESANFMDSMRWFERLKKTAELGPRHEIIGATMTTEEINQWNASGAINMNQTPEDVASRLDAMLDIHSNMTETYAMTAISENRNPMTMVAAGLIDDRPEYHQNVQERVPWETIWAMDFRDGPPSRPPQQQGGLPLVPPQQQQGIVPPQGAQGATPAQGAQGTKPNRTIKWNPSWVKSKK